MVVNLDRFCQSVIKSRLAPREINLWLSISLFASLLVRKHISCVCIHTSIFKKRIHSLTITYVGFIFTFSLFKKRICSVPKKHILYYESTFQCSKRELNLLQIHVCCVSIHISMSKKGIHPVPITYIFFDPHINVPRIEFTHNLCFNPYLNVRKENLLFQGCIRCCTVEKER